jgi:hypothetical protein
VPRRAEHALNRDYEIRNQLLAAVTGRESVKIAGDLDSTSATVDFRIIDPPRVSPKPVAPNRLLILPLVLLAAVALGAVVAFGVSQILPTIHDSRALREVFGRPVLGTVSLLSSPAVVRAARRSSIAFFGGVAGLILVASAGITWLAFVSPVA